MDRKVKGWKRDKKRALIDGRMDDLKLLSIRSKRSRALAASRRRNRDI